MIGSCLDKNRERNGETGNGWNWERNGEKGNRQNWEKNGITDVGGRGMAKWTELGEECGNGWKWEKNGEMDGIRSGMGK